jgi:hypothetical protein
VLLLLVLPAVLLLVRQLWSLVAFYCNYFVLLTNRHLIVGHVCMCVRVCVWRVSDHCNVRMAVFGGDQLHTVHQHSIGA